MTPESNTVPIDSKHLRALAALFGESALPYIEEGNDRVAEFYAMRAGTYANILLDNDPRRTGRNHGFDY